MESLEAFVICESDNLAALQTWRLYWNGVINLEFTPVLDINECRAMLKNKWNPLSSRPARKKIQSFIVRLRPEERRSLTVTTGGLPVCNV